MELEAITDLLPDEWRDFALALVAALIALRTLLHWFVLACWRIDVRDGSADWAWVGKLGDWLDWTDRSVFARLGVKPLGTRESMRER